VSDARISVFLSYRRDDTRHVAGRIADRLHEHFELFMDTDTIEPGMDFIEVIRREVGECDVLLAVMGPRWATLADAHGRRRLEDPNDWVAEEIRVALQRNIRVIPVLVDGADMPDPQELPAELAHLASRQAMTVRHESFGPDADRLIRVIQRIAGTKVPPAATDSGTPDEMPHAGNTPSAEARLHADAEYQEALAACSEQRWTDAIGLLNAVQVRHGRQPAIDDRLYEAKRQKHLSDAYDHAADLTKKYQWDAAVEEWQAIVAANPTYRDAAGQLDSARRQHRIFHMYENVRNLYKAGQWAAVVAASDDLSAQNARSAELDYMREQALAALAAGHPPRRTGDTPSASPPAPRPRRWWILWLSVGVAVAVLAILVPVVFLAALLRPEPTAAPTPEPTPTGSETPIPGLTPAPAAEALLLQIPSDYRDSCLDLGANEAEGILASISCTPLDGPGSLFYYQYETSEQALDEFNGWLGTPGGGTCFDGAAGTSPYVQGDVEAGMLGCYTGAANDVTYVWTHTDSAILGLAWDFVMGYEDFTEWWRNNAGPV
jgi:hypothetical protein